MAVSRHWWMAKVSQLLTGVDSHGNGHLGLGRGMTWSWCQQQLWKTAFTHCNSVHGAPAQLWCAISTQPGWYVPQKEDGGVTGMECGERRGDVRHKVFCCEWDTSFWFSSGSFLLSSVFNVHQMEGGCQLPQGPLRSSCHPARTGKWSVTCCAT